MIVTLDEEIFMKMEPIDKLPEPSRSKEQYDEDNRRIDALKVLIQPGVLAW